jgi:hypothetical protein
LRNKAFLERIKRARRIAGTDGSLRWNQLDVIDAATKFLEAKPGTPFTQFGDDVPDFEKDKKKCSRRGHGALDSRLSPG